MNDTRLAGVRGTENHLRVVIPRIVFVAMPCRPSVLHPQSHRSLELYILENVPRVYGFKRYPKYTNLCVIRRDEVKQGEEHRSDAMRIHGRMPGCARVSGGVYMCVRN